MKRSHKMPFGAECRGDGSVRFRLWAPGASAVELVLVGVDAGAHAMSRLEAGWFELLTDAAKPGHRYFFQVDGETRFPDPASRFQPEDVHGPSEVIDPNSFDWPGTNWNGRPWEEAVIYEIHVGTFTPSGKFSGVIDRLDYLVDLGITAIELMPVADFPGKRNWGYDGVFPFAPDSSYGTPQDLKTLVEAAHAKGLMIFLDVVYNHFGPEGNYLRAYAPQFFTARHKTPWGDGINFDGPESQVVRDFFIHNALYWLVEYNFDGLRFDAVHAIQDDSTPDFLEELAATLRKHIGGGRHIHLMLENDRNEARYLQRHRFNAQWNDDIHHALHVLTTSESDGYYRDYSDNPAKHLGRCLTQGFAYQGEPSTYHGGAPRGESSDDLPPTAFVSFLQNHDQIGNRAFGERITALAEPAAVRAAISILLLTPQPPLLFMGEEFAAGTPFLFFCDFGKQLAQAVTEGRRNEFARFKRFQDPAVRAKIPDPSDVITFQRSALDWQSAGEPCCREWLDFYRRLLRLRKDKIVPLMGGAERVAAKCELFGQRGLCASWKFPAAELTLLANLSGDAVSVTASPPGEALYTTQEGILTSLGRGILPGWSVVWLLQP